MIRELDVGQSALLTDIAMCLNYYRLFSPGLYCCTHVAVQHTDPVEWIWNRLIDGRFSVVKTADHELVMSTALPGLWIPPHALRHRDWWSVMAAIARGVTRVGHHDFMDTIWKPAVLTDASGYTPRGHE